MKKILMAGIVFLGLATAAGVQANSADGCVDPATTQLLCVEGFVVTSYGCTLETEVHCAKVAEIPYAEKETSGGFAPFLNMRKVKIMRDSRVFLVETKFPQGPGGAPVVVTTELKRLSSKTLGMLAIAVKTNSGEKLPPFDYGNGCADAPSTLYRIVQDNGTVIPVAAQVNCVDYIQSDADAEFVKKLLDDAHS